MRCTVGLSRPEGLLDGGGDLLGDPELVDHPRDDQPPAVDVEDGLVAVLIQVHRGEGGGRLLDFQCFLGPLTVVGDLVAVAKLWP
jgi:hypothetical protein